METAKHKGKSEAPPCGGAPIKIRASRCLHGEFYMPYDENQVTKAELGISFLTLCL